MNTTAELMQAIDDYQAGRSERPLRAERYCVSGIALVVSYRWIAWILFSIWTGGRLDPGQHLRHFLELPLADLRLATLAARTTRAAAWRSSVIDFSAPT